MKYRSKLAAALAAALLAVAGVAGCGNNNFRDLEGVSSTDPDWVRLINSPDGHPNVTLYCANGIGYATTTRDYDAFVLVPDLNAFCETKAAAK